MLGAVAPESGGREVLDLVLRDLMLGCRDEER